MFDGTQNWYKVWRKTDLRFQKLIRGIWQIFTRVLESLQIGTLMAYFCLKLKMYELKIYRGVICHDIDSQLKRNWPASSKLTWGIWRILTRALKNRKNLHCNGLLLNKVCNVWAKKSIKELCLMTLNIDAKFERKLTCAFKNDMRNLANFRHSTFESHIIATLMGSFYPK